MPLSICAFKHSNVYIVHCLLIYHVTHMPMTVTSMHISLYFFFIFLFSSSSSPIFSPLCVLAGFAFHLWNKLYVLIVASPFSTLHVHLMENLFQMAFFPISNRWFRKCQIIGKGAESSLLLPFALKSKKWFCVAFMNRLRCTRNMKMMTDYRLKDIKKVEKKESYSFQFICYKPNTSLALRTLIESGGGTNGFHNV